MGVSECEGGGGGGGVCVVGLCECLGGDWCVGCICSVVCGGGEGVVCEVVGFFSV